MKRRIPALGLCGVLIVAAVAPSPAGSAEPADTSDAGVGEVFEPGGSSNSRDTAGADAGTTGPSKFDAAGGAESDASTTSSPDAGRTSAASSTGGDAESPDIPVDRPIERLERADRAFQNGDFERISALLLPVLEPTATFEDREKLVRARELLGVGFYFQARQAPDPSRRDTLMRKAREQFLELLRERPDYELDPLIFPGSAVELFESVKRNHSEELEKLRASESPARDPSSGGTEPLYIERKVERNLFIWNFVPGGAGQFQNEATIKGVLLGSGQVAAVGVHAFGVFRIQSVCPGLRCTSPTDFERAEWWRSVQYVAWGGFGVLYAASVIDALINYKPREVHIRTRDKPPPELSDSGGSTGNGPKVRIGLRGVEIRW